MNTFFGCAVGAAIKGPILFHPVTDYSNPAVGTGRSQSMNSAFKAIESMFLPLLYYIKGFVVIISANFTYSHHFPPVCQQVT
jgi:hypothetical protein